MTKQASHFVPPRNNRIAIWLIKLYARFLFSWHFSQVWFSEKYAPAEEKSTVYFLNHGSWWDTAICFLLNEYIFRQRGLYISIKQIVKKYPIFTQLGALPIDRNPQSKIGPLRYIVKTLHEPGVGLFVFPEGKVNGGHAKSMQFQNGLAWLSLKCPEVDLVPVAVTSHMKFSPKPQLFLAIGHRCRFPKDLLTVEGRTEFLQNQMQKLLEETIHLSRMPDHEFESLW